MRNKEKKENNKTYRRAIERQGYEKEECKGNFTAYSKRKNEGQRKRELG